MVWIASLLLLLLLQLSFTFGFLVPAQLGLRPLELSPNGGGIPPRRMDDGFLRRLAKEPGREGRGAGGFVGPLRVVTDDDDSASSLAVAQQPQKFAATSNKDDDDNVQNYRGIRRVEKFARLPVWPAWYGVLIWLVGLILGSRTGARLEQAIGGRVCPNFFSSYEETSPIIMLVHHCHSFFAFDPLRFLQRTLILPEGFPAHPHRGFVTITYILRGGFVHRDSTGVKQSYGADIDDDSDHSHYQGKHTQWLTTGRGLQHEEMFDIRGWFSRQELYQIWLNLPAAHKMDPPRSILLGGEMDTPCVRTEPGGSETIVLAGSYRGRASAAPCQTDLDLLHVTIPKGSSWSYDVPDDRYQTIFLYVRRGTIAVRGGLKGATSTVVDTHHTAFFEAATTTGHCDRVEIFCEGNDPADFLFLAAVPIREPCVASGSMVMNSAVEINRAYQDYERGMFGGRPWDHKLSDEEWQRHLRQ
jgi:redox-sensitive bicupin YhaK (pirin superfamily)